MKILLPSIPAIGTFPNTLISTIWDNLLNPSLSWKPEVFTYLCFQNLSIFEEQVTPSAGDPDPVSLSLSPCLHPRDVQHHLCKGINKRKGRVSSLCPSDPTSALLTVLSIQKQIDGPHWQGFLFSGFWFEPNGDPLQSLKGGRTVKSGYLFP